jgi:hypothetical protein
VMIDDHVFGGFLFPPRMPRGVEVGKAMRVPASRYGDF